MRPNSTRKSCKVDAVDIMLIVFLMSIVFMFVSIGIAVFRNTCKKMESNIAINRNELNKTTCLDDVPEDYLSKWIAYPSKFKGLDEFARTHGMKRHEVLRYERSRVVMERDSEIEMRLRVIYPHNQHDIDVKLGGKCVYRSEESNYIVYMENGNLHVETAYFTNRGKKNFVTRVYRIGNTDLI